MATGSLVFLSKFAMFVSVNLTRGPGSYIAMSEPQCQAVKLESCSWLIGAACTCSPQKDGVSRLMKVLSSAFDQ